MVEKGGPGRPSVHIPPEVLEELRGVGFTWQKIASIFRVSRSTIMRRVRLFELEHLSLFSSITNEQIDDIIRDYISRHGPGQPRANLTYEDTLEQSDTQFREEGSEKA